MQRILLSCKSVEDARFLKNYIETELPYEVVLAFGVKDIDAAMRTRSVHLLMLQTGQLAESDLDYTLQLRSDGFTYPILFIADGMGTAPIDEISEKHKIYFLERPFELRTFKGLARKLMVSRAVPQQVFRRYRTNITATLETFISGERYDTHMFNLSRGGAYFELTQKPVLGVGDLLRMKVNLSDMDKEHHIHGRIVWTTHKGHAAGGYGIGVKFMKGSDIYTKLLDRV